MWGDILANRLKGSEEAKEEGRIDINHSHTFVTLHYQH